MKRIISGILAFTMLLPFFASCKEKNEDITFDFYDRRLKIVTDLLEEQWGNIEPNLMTENIDVVFYSDGLVRSISGYLYGFDKNYDLKSGYAIDYSVAGKLFVHRQKFDSGGTKTYNLSNDFEQLCDLVDAIDLQTVVGNFNSELCGLLSKGVRDFGYNDENLTEIKPDGSLAPCHAESRDTPLVGQSFSVYVSGRSHDLYERFIYMDTATFHLPEDQQ